MRLFSNDWQTMALENWFFYFSIVIIFIFMNRGSY